MLPASGNIRGQQAINDTRDAAKEKLEWKYTDRPVTEEAIRLTVPLEIKYWRFDEDGAVVRSREMELNEVNTIYLIYLLNNILQIR